MIIKSAIRVICKESNEDKFIIWLYTGLRHPDIIEKLYHDGISMTDDTYEFTEGFITDDNKFLDRYEAKYEALRCHQVKDTEYRALYSEDIWPDE